MRLCEILNEGGSFENTKQTAGYHQAFPSADDLWTDTILRRLRYEEPYANTSSAIEFSNSVEQFFNRKFGGMVYHRGDESVIGKAIESITNSLDADDSVENIKKNVKDVATIMHRFVRQGTIAPEGAHQEETDFWLEQREKDDYMRNRR